MTSLLQLFTGIRLSEGDVRTSPSPPAPGSWAVSVCNPFYLYCIIQMFTTSIHQPETMEDMDGAGRDEQEGMTEVVTHFVSGQCVS